MNKDQALVLLCAVAPLALGFLAMGVVETWRLHRRRKEGR